MAWSLCACAEQYAAEASCAPSRASLLTGRSVRSHNLTRNTDALSPAVLAEGTLASALRSQGYATAHVGKLHVTGMPVDDNPDSPLAATMVRDGTRRTMLEPRAQQWHARSHAHATRQWIRRSRDSSPSVLPFRCCAGGGWS